LIRSSDQIVQTDMVKVGKLDQHIHRIFQHTDFVLGICVLADSQILSDLFLRISMIDAKIAYIFKFQNFIAHIHHPNKPYNILK